MPVTPIVSSENIEGNIGQCQTQNTLVDCTSRVNAFICMDTKYVTNSCTGKVDMYNVWAFSGLGWIVISIGAIVIISAIWTGLAKWASDF